MGAGGSPGASEVAADDLWARIVACQGRVDDLLEVVARQVARVVGDGCVITTVADGEGALEVTAVAHRDPAVEQAMADAAGPLAIGEGIAGAVAADRQVVVLNRLNPETVEQTTPARHQPFLREHPMHALAIVPLVAGDELVGTLGAMRTTEGRPYEAHDVRALQHLAQRISLAIVAARRPPSPVGPGEGEAAFLSSFDAIVITTIDGRVLAANPAASTLAGHPIEELVRLGPAALIDLEAPAVAAAMEELIATGHTRGLIHLHRADGETVSVDFTATVYAHEGETRVLVVGRDASDAVAARDALEQRLAELERVADHDALTGLWNRRGFHAAADRALADADRHQRHCLLVFFDLDGLKAINDRDGHAVGDEAIVAMARALTGATRDADVVCRLGGDEFVVLAMDATEEDATAVVDRVLRELDRTEAGGGVRFSWGAAERAPGDDADLAGLVDAADQDMYLQKVVRRVRQHQDDR